MSLETSERLRDAESLLFMLEDAQGRIRTLRRVPGLLRDAASSSSRIDEIIASSRIQTPVVEPPIRRRAPPSVVYEEQQTQAIHPSRIEALDVGVQSINLFVKLKWLFKHLFDDAANGPRGYFEITCEVAIGWITTGGVSKHVIGTL